MKVVWTQEALERLEDIQYYLAVTEKAPKAARSTLLNILSRESQLREMPESGKVIPDYDDPNLRELLEGSYRIIYQVQDHQVLVLSVMHQRQLLPKVRDMQRTARDAIAKLTQ